MSAGHDQRWPHPNVSGFYAGTFDPVTVGHLDVIERASPSGGPVGDRGGPQPR
jgi:hypothetical protein